LAVSIDGIWAELKKLGSSSLFSVSSVIVTSEPPLMMLLSASFSFCDMSECYSLFVNLILRCDFV